MTMRSKEVFVPARITNVWSIAPKEIRKIELMLPHDYTLEERVYSIHDHMRPGTAFLAKPWGERTEKYRRRMYTRSNCARLSPGMLQTIINDTHKKADTSSWWQTEHIEQLWQIGGTIDVRVDLDPLSSELAVYENALRSEPNNLWLESDLEWSRWKMVAIGFSTGITPFLSYVRYMQAMGFGKTADQPGIHLTLIVSVRHSQYLMEHDELCEYAQAYPEHFRYHPVLTQEWPDDWTYSKGRIIRSVIQNGKEIVDLTSLLDVVPDIEQCHVRLCGTAQARTQLDLGFRQQGISPLSFRAEVW